jgi:two-component sensor histidine kinase
MEASHLSIALRPSRTQRPAVAPSIAYRQKSTHKYRSEVVGEMARTMPLLRGTQRLTQFYIDIPALRPGTVGAYAFAFLCTAIATALGVVIDPYIVGVPFVTFSPAIIITALISGFGAGIFCIVLSTASAMFFLLPPRGSFYIESSADVVEIFVFVSEAFFYVILITGIRLSFQQHRELSRNLEQRVEERSAALRESQDRLVSVVAELQHRTRNLISVVGTIADRTLKTTKTFDDFSATFQDRLEVLGRAQGLLFRTHNGERVTFDELINTELAAQCVQVKKNGSVNLDGPKGVPLRSRTVQSLALALHELITNAVKYGALKEPNARLTIRWQQETSAESGKPWLHLDWKESGVEMPPLDAKPQGGGQGRELIERVLPYQFDAQTSFAMEADGIHCSISLPASEHMIDHPMAA